VIVPRNQGHQDVYWLGDRIQVALAARLGGGRQGTIREVVDEPHLAAKIYATEFRASGKVAPHLKVDARTWLDRDRCPRLAWPVAELRDERAAVGLLMIRFPEGWRELDSMLSSKDRTEIDVSLSWRDLVAIAISLAELVDLVHERGWIVGDLSSNNVLVDNNCRAALVDCDDMIPVGQDVARSPLTTNDYGAWELLSQRSPGAFSFHTDAWSLAILIIQLLQDGVHPFAGPGRDHRRPDGLRQNIRDGLTRYKLRKARFERNERGLSWPPFEMLPPDIRRLASICLVEGLKAPERRPSPREWAEALLAVECRDCDAVEGHLFSSHLDFCPWCDRSRNDPGVPPDLRGGHGGPFDSRPGALQ
jgi:DNA-binding helix-hairpin-helix protein with protein kinase domain